MAASLRTFVPASVRKAGRRLIARRVARRLDDDLRRMAAEPGTVVAGPWLGEVGFELLYWVPFLAWCAETYGIAPDRWLILSRGGTASWYQHFADRYADVFSQVTPDVFRAQHDARVHDLGEQKQTRVTPFDTQLVDGALRTAAVDASSPHALLHPSRMYELMSPYWWGHESSQWVHRHAAYRRLAPADRASLVLPDAPYVAVKFYFNECFPASAGNRAFVAEVVRRLAAAGPVVTLSTGLNLDDHGAFPVDVPGVSHMPQHLDPARNLAVQDAIVAGARAFVGTYGGFSYLAPFHGVPSLAFYSHRAGFSGKHLDVAHEAFDRLTATPAQAAMPDPVPGPALRVREAVSTDLDTVLADIITTAAREHGTGGTARG